MLFIGKCDPTPAPSSSLSEPQWETWGEQLTPKSKPPDFVQWRTVATQCASYFILVTFQVTAGEQASVPKCLTRQESSHGRVSLDDTADSHLKGALPWTQ